MRPSTYDALLSRVRRLIASLGRPPIVAIAGHGGAGKSTLAGRLAADLGVGDDQVVGTDGLYAKTDPERAAMWDLHDWPVLIDLLTNARGAPARLAYGYRWYDGTEGDRDLPMPKVVIVEGIRVIRPEMMPLYDLAVWIEMEPAAAAERAKARNLAQGDSTAELELWDTKWVPEGVEYQRLVRPEELADVVIRAGGLGD